MERSTSEKKARSISAYVILGATLLAFIKTFSLLSPIILSFLLILLISLAINPVILRMRALTGGRKIPTALVTVGLIAGIVLLGWALFGPMKTSTLKFSESLPEYWERLQKPLIKMEQKAVISEEKLQAEVKTEIAWDVSAEGVQEARPQLPPPEPDTDPDEQKSLRSNLAEMVQGVLGSFTAVAVNGVQILVVLITVFFGVVFMLINPRPIVGAMLSVVPERHHNQAVIIMQNIARFVPTWALATMLGMVTIGTLVFLLMWPIFGFMDALILGMTAGVLEVVPYLGPIFSAVPALLLAFGEGGMTPLWVVLAYVAVQVLENNVILPFIMARSVKVHPLAVIFSMLLCVSAFGVLGVLVATPLVAILRIVHNELFRKRFLPTVTDADLNRLAGIALDEKPFVGK
ncbi:MAG: AI-2E family transporter [Desulfopila sp.]